MKKYDQVGVLAGTHRFAVTLARLQALQVPQRSGSTGDIAEDRRARVSGAVAIDDTGSTVVAIA